MSELLGKLRDEFRDDKDYAHAYMEGVIDSHIATQIKVLREQNGWSQEKLASESGMKQERISVLENVNYSSWSLNTLRKLARAFDLVVTVSFERFGSEMLKVNRMSADELRRAPRKDDLSMTPALSGDVRLADTSGATGTIYVRVEDWVDSDARMTDQTVSDMNIDSRTPTNKGTSDGNRPH